MKANWFTIPLPCSPFTRHPIDGLIVLMTFIIIFISSGGHRSERTTESPSAPLGLSGLADESRSAVSFKDFVYCWRFEMRLIPLQSSGGKKVLKKGKRLTGPDITGRIFWDTRVALQTHSNTYTNQTCFAYTVNFSYFPLPNMFDI